MESSKVGAGVTRAISCVVVPSDLEMCVFKRSGTVAVCRGAFPSQRFARSHASPDNLFARRPLRMKKGCRRVMENKVSEYTHNSIQYTFFTKLDET